MNDTKGSYSDRKYDQLVDDIITGHREAPPGFERFAKKKPKNVESATDPLPAPKREYT